MSEFADLIHKRLGKVHEIIEKTGALSPDPQSVKVSINFMPIQVNEENACFIPLGSKDAPAGISNTDADYILFMYPDGELSYVEVEIIKLFIKENYQKLKKDIDPYEFKISGVILPLDLLGA